MATSRFLSRIPLAADPACRPLAFRSSSLTENLEQARWGFFSVSARPKSQLKFLVQYGQNYRFYSRSAPTDIYQSFIRLNFIYEFIPLISFGRNPCET